MPKIEMIISPDRSEVDCGVLIKSKKVLAETEIIKEIERTGKVSESNGLQYGLEQRFSGDKSAQMYNSCFTEGTIAILEYGSSQDTDRSHVMVVYGPKDWALISGLICAQDENKITINRAWSLSPDSEKLLDSIHDYIDSDPESLDMSSLAVSRNTIILEAITFKLPLVELAAAD